MIKLKDVSKKYDDIELFSNVNLEIMIPGIYSFVGNNGCGKTTLLNLMMRFIEPSSGKVENNFKNSSFISQNVSLIDCLTIREHFKLLDLDVSLLKQVRLLSKADSYPKELSLGMRQRISVLMALYSNNDVIAMDEPTSHLDKYNSMLIMNLIKKVSKDKVVLLVSHDLEFIDKYSDAIYELNNCNLKIIRKIAYKKELNKVEEKKKRKNFSVYFKKSVKFDRVNFMYALMLFLIFFISLICFNLKDNFEHYLDENKSYSLEYNKFYIKECEEIEKKEIIVKKCKNPSQEKLNILGDIGEKIGMNYELFMNDLYSTDKFSVISPTSFKLIKGRYPLEYNEVIASERYVIGEKIVLEANKVINYKKVDIYNNKLVLEVVGICDDILFLKNDKFYLDYDLIDSFIKNEKLINNNISLYSYFNDISLENYKYILYFQKLDLEIFDKYKMDYVSSVYDYYSGLFEVIDGLSKTINYLGVFSVIISIYYACKLILKMMVIKNGDMLFFKAIGIKKRKIIKMFHRHLLFFCVISSLIAISMSVTLFWIILKKIYFNISNFLLMFLIILIFNDIIVRNVVKRKIAL